MRVNVTIEWCHDTTFRLANDKKCEELNPKELLLYATAECAGITVMSILAKERIKPKSLEIELSGELDTDTVMAKSIYNEFHIRYNAECRHIEEQSKVSHAIRLANEKYCGMLQMIGKIAPVSHEISIVSSETVEA
ncbi:MAG: OsmC family protein [Alistipes sp.]|jgi:putative redox protein|nr:OsmC family protein [Alistipes sp.]